MEKDKIWFKNEFIPLLSQEYKIEYSVFQDGDFGNLERFEIEGNNKGGNIDFWSLGWLNIHLVDYESGNELLNILLEPHQEREKEEAFKKLEEFL
ncbi:MAG: hypothetical protein LBQ60_16120 [Bacteroidales bacterium]|jgi:hypothetical protein|nr:hypothetical protein [Bacteroidales bacterium]